MKNAAAVLYLFIIYTTLSRPVMGAEKHCVFQCECDSDTVYCIKKGLKGLPNLEKTISENNYSRVEVIDNEFKTGILEGGSFNFTGGDKITHLRLSRNQIKSLEKDSLLGLNKLQNLWLDGNDLDKLDQVMLKDLHSLRKLYLQQNKIGDISEGSLNLPELQLLDLSANELTSLDDQNVFSRLIHLRKLYLEGNKLTYLQNKVFYPLTNLKDLSLNKNNLYYLPGLIFANFSKLDQLNLEQNPWMCSCDNFYGYQTWLSTQENKTLYDLQCNDTQLLLSEADIRSQCLPATIISEKNCSLEVSSGKLLQMICEVTGSFKPWPTWTLPFQMDERTSFIRKSIDGVQQVTVKIENIQPGEQGLYFCKAENQFGKEDLSYCKVAVLSLTTTPSSNIIWPVVSVLCAIIILVGCVSYIRGWRIRRQHALDSSHVVVVDHSGPHHSCSSSCSQ